MNSNIQIGPMFANHIIVIWPLYDTSTFYVTNVFYDLSNMTIGWKMACWTFNDYLSFATSLLRLRAFSHIMFIEYNISHIWNLRFKSCFLCRCFFHNDMKKNVWQLLNNFPWYDMGKNIWGLLSISP